MQGDTYGIRQQFRRGKTMEKMTYDEAVKFIIKNKSQAFNYSLRKQGEQVIGANIYILRYNDDFEKDPDEEDEFDLKFVGGLFREPWGEEDIWYPEIIPSEAKELKYYPVKKNLSSIDFNYEVQIVLEKLTGRSSKTHLD